MVQLKKHDFAMKLDVEQLEQHLNLEAATLEAVTFLQTPQRGQLVSAGVPVKKGETLLRWELEELYYLSDDTQEDWFAMVPRCSRELCALVNIEK